MNGREHEEEVTRDTLKVFLLDSGISRKRLGEMCGVSLATINGWCSCTPIPARKQALIREIMNARARKERSPYMTVKCSPHEAELIKEAAGLLGEPLSEFCLRACLVRATAVLGGRSVKTSVTPSEPAKD